MNKLIALAWLLLAVGCTDASDDIVLENDSEQDKADSVNNKRLSVTANQFILVTSDSEGCRRSGDDPWVCGGNNAWGAVDVFVDGDVVSMRGSLVMPAAKEPFYIFEAKHEGFGLPNVTFIKYGQLMYTRAAGTEQWTVVRCPGMNYFSSRARVDMTARTITDSASGKTFALSSCGAPAGDFEVSSFAFPVSRWFSLEDQYNYTLGINLI
jgi:hypothetical protein